MAVCVRRRVLLPSAQEPPRRRRRDKAGTLPDAAALVAVPVKSRALDWGFGNVA